MATQMPFKGCDASRFLSDHGYYKQVVSHESFPQLYTTAFLDRAVPASRNAGYVRRNSLQAFFNSGNLP